MDSNSRSLFSRSVVAVECSICNVQMDHNLFSLSLTDGYWDRWLFLKLEQCWSQQPIGSWLECRWMYLFIRKSWHFSNIKFSKFKYIHRDNFLYPFYFFCDCRSLISAFIFSHSFLLLAYFVALLLLYKLGLFLVSYVNLKSIQSSTFSFLYSSSYWTFVWNIHLVIAFKVLYRQVLIQGSNWGSWIYE